MAAISAPVAAAAIQGGFSTVGGLFSMRQSTKNREAQKEENMLNRNEARMFYGWERNDAMQDWARQNWYNHPLQQMQRLREAGLNPNLVYGKGADNTAAMIRGASSKPSDQKAPQDTVDYRFLEDAARNSILTYQQVRMQQAQTDNIYQQTALARAEEQLKIASTAATLQGTARSKYDLEFAQEMKDTIKKSAELDVMGKQIHQQYELDENERRKLANTADVQKTLMEIQRIKLENTKNPLEKEKLREEINLLKQTQLVHKVEAELAKQGINPKDPWYMRNFMTYLHKLKDTPAARTPNKMFNESEVERILREYKQNKR